MEVYAKDKLFKFCLKHANAKGAVIAWLGVIERSNWRTPQEIKERYAGADFLANKRVIFNIKGNHYRVVVQMDYRKGAAIIKWIGTHAQYDKETFQ